MVKSIIYHRLLLPITFIVFVIGLFILFNPSYIIIDIFLWVGILTLPFTFKVSINTRSLRFFWPALAFGTFSLYFSSTFGAFCVMVFAILLTIEMFLGKLSLLTMFHLLLLSPLFKYFTSLITFPLRIQISKIVAKILQSADFDIELSGNLITFNGTEFLVDKACMGLHLLGYSFLFGLLILAFFERKNNDFRLSKISIYMTVILILNLIANTVRATLLILFKIMPDYWFHDIVGLLIFVIYVLTPFYFIVKYQSQRQNDLIVSNSVKHQNHKKLAVYLILILYASTIWRNNLNNIPFEDGETIEIHGYAKSLLKSNVLKLSNDHTIIYVKPPVAPYKADHNPLICWEGSGYSFKKIATKTFSGQEVYYAELVKGKDKLYTAWWFQFENHVTNSQWKWRWNNIKNDHQYN